MASKKQLAGGSLRYCQSEGVDVNSFSIKAKYKVA